MAEGGMNGQQGNLCKSGCGFYGNEIYEGMCSKCHKDSVERDQQQMNSSSGSPSTHMANVRDVSGSASAVPKIVKATEPLVDDSAVAAHISPDPSGVDDHAVAEEDEVKSEASSTPTKIEAEAEVEPLATPDNKSKKKRCQKCRKKLGLTAIMCRCGSFYCSGHLYSDRHDCTYDFQEEGRIELQKKNPTIVNPKVTQI